MYRKLIFIVLTMLQYKIEIKFALLLFISYISIFYLYKSRPFISKKFNMLEITSNISTSIILFCGAIYINDLGGIMEILGCLIISFVNGFFFLTWLLFVIRSSSLINAQKLIKTWSYLFYNYFKKETKIKKHGKKIRLTYGRKQKKVWE